MINAISTSTIAGSLTVNAKNAKSVNESMIISCDREKDPDERTNLT